MCVIIYVKKGEEINQAELKAAWRRNPDGAGYAIRKDGKILFHRGFMTFKEYRKVINKLNKKFDLMIHVRITTSNEVNALQTHPYAIEDVTQLGGESQMVISMNGSIRGQKLKEGFNDTMSFIEEYRYLFTAMLKQKEENEFKYYGDTITRFSGAKWCMMTKDFTYTSPQFIEKNNILFSNIFHRKYLGMQNNIKINNIMKNEKLLTTINKDIKLLNKINNFVYNKCSRYYCTKCTKCLYKANTLRDVKITLKENQ